MSHFLLIPTNENGVILDEHVHDNLEEAMSAPFAFTDVFIYSHGWWTDANRCMTDYNRFSLDFSRFVRQLAAGGAEAGAIHPDSIGLGIHWPSMLSEDSGSLVNYLQATSFYTMEKRADTIGENAVYTLVRLILGYSGERKFRLHFIGHSFGCKVVCAALQEIVAYQATPTSRDCYSNATVLSDAALAEALAGCEVNVVLLQAAFDDNDLEIGDIYGDVVKTFPKLRMLVTTSQNDKALQVAYKAAHLVNFFRSRNSRIALGAGGPTPAVVDLFGGPRQRASVSVAPRFTGRHISGRPERLVVADLTPIHQARVDAQPPLYAVDGFSGQHSDIFFEEVYQLIAGFLF